MAFPTVESITETAGNGAGSGAGCPVDLPATVSSGDLLLVVACYMSGTTPNVMTAPAGWTELDQATPLAAAGAGRTIIMYRISDGTEGGTTVNVSAATANVFGTSAQCYRISGWEGTAAGLDLSSPVLQRTNSNVLMPSVTAGGGSADNLFIGLIGCQDDNGFVTVASSSYTNLTATVSGNTTTNQGSSVNSFRRELAAASDSPGNAQLSELEGSAAWLAVVAPAPAASGEQRAETDQFLVMASMSGTGVPSTSGFYALVASAGPAAESGDTAQQAAITAVSSDLTTPSTSQAVTLVAFGTGVREDNTQRAWTFDMDGHLMYVITLGQFGTWVYDLTTQQIAEWGTEGYVSWNAERGTMFGDRIVAADIQTPQVYELVFDKALDEGFRPVRRKVTGIIPSSSRDFVSVNMLAIDASMGDGQTGFDGTAQMTIFFSDDQGQSYVEFDTRTVSSTDDSQELLFYSLGGFNRPGRVFRIEDLGGPVRIGGADVWLGTEDNNG